MGTHGAHRRKFWLHPVVRAAAWVVGIWVVVSLAAVVVLRFVNPPVTAVMIREPGPLSALQYRWVDRAAISDQVAHAVIAAEDQRFLTHAGIDIDALTEAIEDYRRGDELRGASTITQQTAKNLFLWKGRSLLRKAVEAWFALLIDLIWSKQRILEVYLNVAEFGPGIFGVEAAALRFYGTPASQLDAARAATLAAVLPSPKRMDAGTPSEYVRRRRAEILEQMRLLEERGHFAGLRW